MVTSQTVIRTHNTGSFVTIQWKNNSGVVTVYIEHEKSTEWIADESTFLMMDKRTTRTVINKTLKGLGDGILVIEQDHERCRFHGFAGLVFTGGGHVSGSVDDDNSVSLTLYLFAVIVPMIISSISWRAIKSRFYQ